MLEGNKVLEENKILSDMKELTSALSIVLDYAMCSKIITKYNPSGSPNLLNVQRMVNRIKKEYEI